MRLLSTCVPFLGICGIHVAAPLYWNWNARFVRNATLAAQFRRITRGSEKTFELLLPARLSAP